jgi:hypothetical protein
MSTKIIIIVAIVLLFISIIVTAVILTSGGEEEKDQEMDYSGGMDDLEETTEPPYTKSSNKDIGGLDIGCFSGGESADFCKEKCDNDETCKGYNYIHVNGPWKEKSGCCYKTGNSPLSPIDKIDFYSKN